MIPIRLPWRPRARPSATLHEIPVCSVKSELGNRYYRRPGGLSSVISRDFAVDALAICFWRPLRAGAASPWWQRKGLCVSCSFAAAWSWWCSDFEPLGLLSRFGFDCPDSRDCHRTGALLNCKLEWRSLFSARYSPPTAWDRNRTLFASPIGIPLDLCCF